MKLEEIKRLRFRTRMQLREVHKIVEWKDGCIYRTKSLGMIICPSDYKLDGVMIGPVSTKVSRLIGA